MNTGGTSYYYLTDIDASVHGLANAARTHNHNPYGQDASPPVEAVPQPYRLQSTYLQPSGPYKTGARYYDPTPGHFTQTDPSGQETNPYTALADDPINHTDPNGRSFFGKASKFGYFVSLTKKLITEDDSGAFAAKVGFFVGIGTEAICDAAAAAGAAPTLRASIGLGITGCTVLASGLAAAATAGTEAAQ
ncbi:RHS repeat-associated core domain-containing protein [Streptomyces sp. NPDC088910]|uniref:RHS repeat-associated core domain-containing protein n=1 Tax=Streptomyces sp. NPDC088910 TaxID=3365911 RepID=UPI0038180A77